MSKTNGCMFLYHQTRANFSRLMMDLSPTAKLGMPHPIIFVPVGSKADRVMLTGSKADRVMLIG